MSALSFGRAQAIADAVLLEGYVLYPYRCSSAKNQYRWTFGVVAPRCWSVGGGSDTWWIEAQVLVESARPRGHARVRFLQVVDRRIERWNGDAGTPPVQVESLEVGDRVLVPFEEGELREVDVEIGEAGEVAFVLPSAERVEVVYDFDGEVAGRIVRRLAALEGLVRVRLERIDLLGRIDGARSQPLSRVSLRIENRSDHPPGAPRAAAMHASFVSTHVLFASERDDIVSLIDPPPFARGAAASCSNVGTYPILAGAPGRRDLALCSPIILYDYPTIAPESPGDFFDATEIDEILALRTNALTPEEKRIVRATDARAAALLDRVEAMGAPDLAELHGAIRDAQTPEMRPPEVRAPATRFVRGSRVRLRPKRAGRRTDAQDFLYDGYIATVEDVLDDVDGRQYLAVTLDDDPASELHRWYGRFHHYYPDEVEPLGEGEASR